MPDVKLNEFDKSEWRDVYFAFKPHDTEEDFEMAWAEFAALKKQHALN